MKAAEKEEHEIPVEVAYARPERQRLISLSVTRGCTALEAVQLSGILQEFPEIEPAKARMGVFSNILDGRMKPLPGDYELEAGDRVEIYRPLVLDPKQARLQRAKKAK